MYRIIILVFLLTPLFSCAQSVRDQFPGTPQPPLNRPTKPVTNDARKDFQRIPDRGAHPVAIFTSNKQPYLGEFRGTAKGAITENGTCLSLDLNRGVSVDACFALPEGFEFPKKALPSLQVDLRSLSGLEGKKEHLYLQAPESKEFGMSYHFEQADDPQTVKFGKLPPVQQQKASGNESANYQEVETRIETDNGPQSLKIGQPATVRFGGVTFRVYLHTSTYLRNGGSCGEGGYILRVLFLSGSGV